MFSSRYNPDDFQDRGRSRAPKHDEPPIDFEQKHLDYIDRQRDDSRNKRQDRHFRDDVPHGEDDGWYSAQDQEDRANGFYLGRGEFFHEDLEREEERRRWEAQMRRTVDEEAEEERKRRDQRVVLNQLMADTKQGREKHQELQMKRKLAKLSRSEAIKQRSQSIKEQQREADEKPDVEEALEKPEEDLAESQQRLRLKRPKLS